MKQKGLLDCEQKRMLADYHAIRRAVHFNALIFGAIVSKLVLVEPVEDVYGCGKDWHSLVDDLHRIGGPSICEALESAVGFVDDGKEHSRA